MADAYALRFVGDVGDLQAKFAQVPGFTDRAAAAAAEKLVLRMQKAQQQAGAAATAAASQAGKAWESAADRAGNAFGRDVPARLDAIGEKAGRMESGLMGVAGALDQVNPKMGAAARVGGDLVGSLESVSRLAKLSPVGLAAVGAAALTLGGGFLYLRSELQEAEAEMAEQASTASKLQSALEGLDGVVASLDEDYRLLTGEVDKFGLALEGRLGDISREFGEARKGLQGLLEDEKQHLDSLLAQNSILPEVQDQIRGSRREIANLQRAVQGLNEREAEQVQRAQDVVELQRETAESSEFLARRQREQAEATRSSSEALREQEARLRAISEVADTWAAGVADLAFELDQVQALPAERVVDPATVRELRDLQVAVDELVPPSALEEVDQLRLLLFDMEMQAAQSEQALWALTDPMTRVRDRIRQIEQSELDEAMDSHRESIQRFTGAMATSLMDMGNSIVTIMENSGEKGVAAAWGLSRALSIAQVIFYGAQAAMAALAPPPIGLGPVLGAPLAITMGVQTGLQVAAIATVPKPTTTAHSGQTFGDEAIVNAQVGERMVSRAARAQPGVDAMLDRAERGMSAGGGQQVLVLKDAHRIVGRAVVRTMRKARMRATIQDAARTPGGWR